MNIFNFFLKKLIKQPIQAEQDTFSIEIDYSKHTQPTVTVQTPDETYEYDLEFKYVCLSTSGDENVCPMCAQFEGKFFLEKDAPKLPLCPSCACAYLYYDKQSLPSGTVISNKEDFIFPAECTSLFYKHQQDIFNETDTEKIIRICERDLKKLPELMAPYLAANFPAPEELLCRDLLPDLYMQLGKWDKAEKAIKNCINANAYFPDDGSEELAYLESYKKIATETLYYIQQTPGYLQRNIYKKMGYEGEERELLKNFLRYSKLIKKVKYNNTNQLFCDIEETINKSITTKYD